MSSLRRVRRILRDEDLAEAAKACKTRKEFERRFPSEYVLAARRGIRDKITGHMTDVYKRRTPEEVLALAAGYATLKDFREAHPNEYAYMVRSRKVAELSSKFLPAQTGIGHHLVYQYEFPDGIYIGISCSKDLREKYHLIRGAVAKHLQCTGQELPPMKILYRELMPSEACYYEKKVIEECRVAGLKLLNTSGGGQLGAFGRTAWTKEKVKAIAAKYKTRTAFRTGDRTAFQVAADNGWKEEVCAHMKIIRRQFSEEEIRLIAGQYLTMGEFLSKDHSCYNAARARGLLDEVCSHMIRLRKRRRERHNGRDEH